MLKHKVALITGAAKGIGRQIALNMAAAGAKIVVGDVDAQGGEATVQTIRASGGEAFFAMLDVTNAPQIAHAVADANAAFGTIDIVVPNASITSRKRIDELTEAEWMQTINVNLTGTFLVLKAVLPQMAAQAYGRVIVITSASAITGSGGGVHYAATKAGQNAIVRNLAREYGPHSITANAIAPRVIQTEILDALYPPGAAQEALCRSIPVGRLGQPDDVASLAVFLASASAGYINGQIMLVDGGKTFSSL